MNTVKYSVFCVLALLLVACDGNNSPLRSFTVQIDNLTENQPFAPLAVVLHKPGYHPYSLGDMADMSLESLAEGGDPSELLAAADSNPAVLAGTASTGLTLPGNKTSVAVKGLSTMPRLSVVGMLVNTNDGFIGLDDVDLSELKRGETLVLNARIYDAGTEANTESAASVPGQGGEGFNAARDDRDFVAVHPGVVSMDDGLGTSSLDQSHRFDNPGARIRVTRL